MIFAKSISLRMFADIRRGLLALATVLLTLLAACSGGGVGSSGTGVPTGSQIGTITGFGSVIVESNTYDESGAQVSLDDDPDSPLAIDSSQLALGMQVVVQFDDQNRASRIRVVPQLIGTVETASDISINVAGQTVLISADGARPTIVDGDTALADLSGSRVRVFGQFDAGGQLRATRIEQLADASAVLVTGLISAIDPDGTLRMGGLAIRSAGRTNVRPSGAQPLVGDVVVAYSRSGLTAQGLPADALVILSRLSEPGERFRGGGIIRATDGNSTLLVGSRRVSVAAASITGGSVADLQPGRIVIYAGTRTDGNVLADQVLLLPDINVERQVLGQIDLFGDASRFSVRRTVIDASAASFVGGNAGNLRAGVTVLVRGVLNNGVLIASEVRIF